MRFFFKGKDGGPDSTVTGYWLVEIKSLFSIVLLRFDGESREAYHTHAFNSFSWLLKGALFEKFQSDKKSNLYLPSLVPFVTTRNDFHMVSALPRYAKTAWVLSFRGPWAKNWMEYIPAEDQYKTLSKGRVVEEITEG